MPGAFKGAAVLKTWISMLMQRSLLPERASFALTRSVRLAYASDMRRVLLSVVGLYVLLAAATTAAESSGHWRRCGCEPGCWCKKPALRLFRWVVPAARHRSIDPIVKQQFASDRP